MCHFAFFVQVGQSICQPLGLRPQATNLLLNAGAVEVASKELLHIANSARKHKVVGQEFSFMVPLLAPECCCELNNVWVVSTSCRKQSIMLAYKVIMNIVVPL